MAWVLLALGLVMLVEGLAYVLAPSLIERVLEVLRTLPESARRQFGALVLVSGLICIWLAFFIGL
ncbi:MULTISPECIES: DUF2065 domain-containing protein [Tateyamaria]|uniref:DUF2065 domain-containing protein n=1 Tax=Tateyamaria omphalii TaxID=299262 RepID=A0A1P8MSQ1_9RHOB|nr:MULTISPECIES: DUF2065 domain-containing protein [Tateyamaria]APX11081.1 DUF2065 domain-containing protein [Tateyamaria omphalii]KIC50708.1 hypothetical protein RA29_01870 [Tateyamaria sp. ANG-S1]